MTETLLSEDSVGKRTLPIVLIRVFVKGGIISPGDLLGVLKVAQALDLDYIHLGSRQDILFPIEKSKVDLLPVLLAALPLPYEYQESEQQNIISSYITRDIISSTRWLAPHIYHYVLDSFDYLPTHKINIIDPLQGMVPLFTGNINFIASPIDNYWYLYFRYTDIQAKPWCCPELIYGFDLAKVAQAVEKLNPLANQLSFSQLYEQLKQQVHFNTRPIEQPLAYPDTMFPYYEGINLMEGGKYWMGLYWRNNRFTIKFLQALCEQCLATNIGNIGLTPWKSIVVKGITEGDRLAWEKLLGKYGINMRHSSLELNWHIPVADDEALELKNYLVRVLDQRDISTYGLTFSVKTQAHQILFSSVAIERVVASNEQAPTQYNILYAKDFNPNLFEFIYYARSVSKEVIPSLLIELSKKYYEQLHAKTVPSEKSVQLSLSSVAEDRQVYQCTQCLGVYDSQIGNPSAEINPGVTFEDLPEDYTCHVCSAPKASFAKITLSELL
ncbi:rubredoxin [Tunicatimonas pelagia]|uniref:rubredoxin n=1 Tax=Tunicatimonas pelagia TaxID=931531 RepID=UPI002665C643|nr:rubredoxin [Tunicatimonas pelagia]WKN45251.1 rubredoxin [Tunicatimonas pelagia]